MGGSPGCIAAAAAVVLPGLAPPAAAAAARCSSDHLRSAGAKEAARSCCRTAGGRARVAPPPPARAAAGAAAAAAAAVRCTPCCAAAAPMAPLLRVMRARAALVSPTGAALSAERRSASQPRSRRALAFMQLPCLGQLGTAQQQTPFPLFSRCRGVLPSRLDEQRWQSTRALTPHQSHRRKQPCSLHEGAMCGSRGALAPFCLLLPTITHCCTAARPSRRLPAL